MIIYNFSGGHQNKMKQDPLFGCVLQKPVNNIEFLYTIYISVVKIHSEEKFRMRVSDFP